MEIRNPHSLVGRGFEDAELGLTVGTQDMQRITQDASCASGGVSDEDKAVERFGAVIRQGRELLEAKIAMSLHGNSCSAEKGSFPKSFLPDTQLSQSSLCAASYSEVIIPLSYVRAPFHPASSASASTSASPHPSFSYSFTSNPALSVSQLCILASSSLRMPHHVTSRSASVLPKF